MPVASNRNATIILMSADDLSAAEKGVPGNAGDTFI
jgi:hypothetical protein